MSRKKFRETPPGFANLGRTQKESEAHAAVMRTLMYLDPLDEPPPEDMPAIEKIKIYARAGFLGRYAGTSERFESIWAEAFPEGEKGRK